jgi:hypothetical protein
LSLASEKTRGKRNGVSVRTQSLLIDGVSQLAGWSRVRIPSRLLASHGKDIRVCGDAWSEKWVMFRRFTSYVTSRPRRTVAIILTLAVAFFVAVAGLALELSHFDQAPYPSQKVPVKLVNDGVIYTQDITFRIGNGTAVTPYSWMKIQIRVSSGGTSIGMPIEDFGNGSLLSEAGSSMTQVLMTSTLANVTINITESSGDGGFDEGDTIFFHLVPLRSDVIFTMGLVWPDHVAGGMVMEISFAVHHGKLFAWYSDYLGDSWYWQFLTKAAADQSVG